VSALRVLVADDDAYLRRGVADLIEHLGHVVVEVGDGAALARALHDAAARGRPFDLLFSDVRMPGTCVFEVLQATRAEGVVPCTVLLTGYPEDAVFYRAYRCGCLSVLTKPFDASELRGIVSLAARAVASSGG
jgi:CheY-like chemotaxis protein